MSSPDATPFDHVMPVNPRNAANLLRAALQGLRFGKPQWALEQLEFLAGELEVDASIIAWVESRRERGEHFVNQ